MTGVPLAELREQIGDLIDKTDAWLASGELDAEASRWAESFRSMAATAVELCELANEANESRIRMADALLDFTLPGFRPPAKTTRRVQRDESGRIAAVVEE